MDLHKSLIDQAKTTYHPNAKVEYLIWQLALALEETLEELNALKNDPISDSHCPQI